MVIIREDWLTIVECVELVVQVGERLLEKLYIVKSQEPDPNQLFNPTFLLISRNQDAIYLSLSGRS